MNLVVTHISNGEMMSKKEQLEIASVLFEMGMSFDVIEAVTKIKAEEYLKEILNSQECKKHR